MKFMLILALINIYSLVSIASELTNKKRNRKNYSLPKNKKKFSKQCPHNVASEDEDEDEDDPESNILKLILSKALLAEHDQQEDTTEDFVYDGEESILDHHNIKKFDFDKDDLDSKIIKTKTYIKHSDHFQKTMTHYQKYITKFKDKAKTIPFIVYGPSGCGKSTLVKEIAINEQAYLYDLDIKKIKKPKLFIQQLIEEISQQKHEKTTILLLKHIDFSFNLNKLLSDFTPKNEPNNLYIVATHSYKPCDTQEINFLEQMQKKHNVFALHIPSSCLDIYTEIFQHNLNFINIHINKKTLHELLEKYAAQPSVFNYNMISKLQHSTYLNFLDSNPKEQDILDYITICFDEEIRILNDQKDSPPIGMYL
jgi:hypothetical protein